MKPLNPNEIQVSIYPPTPRGGQHVRPEAGILALHIPTGIGVVVIDDRSQVKNRAKALMLLEWLVEIVD